MHLSFLLVFYFVSWSEQHLSYPIIYCNMASTCIHDNRPVCASTPNGCSRRTFLDQCDMYEYNCDYNTRYQETYMLHCVTSDLEAGVSTAAQPISEISNLPDQMTFIEENLIEADPPTMSTKCVSTSSTTTPNTIPTTASTCPNTKACVCATSITASFTISTTTTRPTSTSTTTRATLSTTRENPIITSTTLKTTRISLPTETTKSPSITMRSSTATTPTVKSSPKLSPVSTTTFLTSIFKTTANLNETPIIKTAGTQATSSHPDNKTELKVTLIPTSKVPSPFIRSTISTLVTTTTELATTIPRATTTLTKILGFTGCCERPITWDTTTDNMKTILLYSNEVHMLFENTTTPVDDIDTNTKPLPPVVFNTIPSIAIESTTISTLPSTIAITTKPLTFAPKTTEFKNVTSTISQTISTVPMKTTKKINSTDATKICIGCERPKTWETTTEDIKTVFVYPSEETEALTSTISSTSSTTRSTTSVPLVVTTISPSTSFVNKSADPMTYIPISTEIKNISSTILQTTTTIPAETTNKTTICLNCERPKAWETTTEKELPYIFVLTENEPIDTETTTEKTTAFVSTTDPVTMAPPAISTPRTIVYSSPHLTTSAQTTSEAQTSPVTETAEELHDIEYHASNETAGDMITLSDPETVDIYKLAMSTKTSPKSTWWYPTSRKSKNCERPFTWLTTKRKRQWHRRL